MKTTYDEMRDELRKQLEDCAEKAKKLMNREIYGYDEIPKDYAINIYKAISDVLDII